ncbi:MAG TPA: hypothetical protein VMN78_09435 [Longimicrobiales bacterium]|nr:hypothetical protein [Longimicrobiales bacterium]
MRGLRFPEELRLASTSPLLEAAGARAYVVECDDGFELTVDGLRGSVRVVEGAPPKDGAAAACWPFGSERRHADSPGTSARVERVFAAPAHPVVVIERQCGEAVDLRLDVRLEDGVRARIEPDARIEGSTRLLRLGAGDTARIVVMAGEDALADIDALVAAAVARARRRAANRPSLIVRVDAAAAGVAVSDVRPTASAGDELAALEHVVRLSLARPATQSSAAQRRPAAPAAEAHAESRVLVALALLGLNDPAPARGCLAEEQDPARMAVMAGAWAAWTGDAEALEHSRLRLTSWLRSELAITTERADESDESGGADEAVAWRRAARALAPGLVELLGDAALGALLRDRGAPGPDLALRSLAQAAAGSSAGAGAAAGILELLHGTLGIVPDAPRARLRLAPRMQHTTLQLARLTVGDATFALEAALLGETEARLRVEQTAGAAPYTVILEPWLRARRLASALVDGAPAQLDAAYGGDGLRPRVQLVADHPREVLLDLE